MPPLSKAYPHQVSSYFSSFNLYRAAKIAVCSSSAVAAIVHASFSKNLNYKEKTAFFLLGGFCLSLSFSERITRALNNHLFSNQSNHSSSSYKLLLLFRLFYEKVSLPGRQSWDYQALLPDLPLPDLKQTITRFQEWTSVLAKEKPWNNETEIWQDFLKNEGPELQSMLYAYTWMKRNYFEEIWIKITYLTKRDPLPLSYSWFGHDKVKAHQEFKTNVSYDFALGRMAKLLQAYAENFQRLNSHTYPTHMWGSTKGSGIPLCMDPYKLTVGMNRIPAPREDYLKAFPDSRYIIAVFKGYYFKVPILDEKGHPICWQELQACLKELHNTTRNLEKAPPVGALTGETRDNWAILRECLKIKNKEALKMVEEACMLVNFSEDSSGNNLEEKARDYFLLPDVRWYDKLYNLKLFSDGQVAGFVEHTPVDAAIPARVWDENISKMETYTENPQFQAKKLSIELIRWDLSDTFPQKDSDFFENAQKKWNLDEEAFNSFLSTVDLQKFAGKNLCEIAEESHLETERKLKSFHLHVCEHTTFGKEHIKNTLKVNPDSFVQMGIQLAHYLTLGKTKETYEAASMQAFEHGRTDMLRPRSDESEAMVKLLSDQKGPSLEKRKAILKAINEHVKRRREVTKGQGTERHLLALTAIAYMKLAETHPNLQQEEIQQKLPKALQIYLERSNFSIATSQLPCPSFDGGGFLPVDHNEGTGLFYTIKDDHIILNVTDAFNDSAIGKALAKNLSEAFSLLNDSLNYSDDTE